MTTCAIPNCDEEVATGQLMCRPHWFAVPRDIRHDVTRTWRHVKNGTNKTDEYWTHREAAIAAVVEQMVGAHLPLPCPACNRLIVYLRTPKGGWMMADWSDSIDRASRLYRDAYGSHWKTCDDVGRLRDHHNKRKINGKRYPRGRGRAARG